MPIAVTLVHVADRPDLIDAAVKMAWAEWGSGLPPEERERWLAVHRGDVNRDRVPAGFFAVGEDGSLIGSVSLHEFDIDSHRDRSPWLCGMLVRANARGRGIGRLLVRRLERFAAGIGIARMWVFTERAADFYESCGWARVEELPHAPGHGPGTILVRVLPGG